MCVWRGGGGRYVCVLGGGGQVGGVGVVAYITSDKWSFNPPPPPPPMPQTIKVRVGMSD